MTFQRKLLLAAGGGWLFDAMDLLLVGSVVAERDILGVSINPPST